MARLRLLVATLFMALAAVGGAPPARAAAFFNTLDDVPLPPGFSERTALATAFEGEPGRILVAVAEGPGSSEAARAWIVAALKGLGWSLAEAEPTRAVLLRGRETLTLETEAAATGATLRVRVIVRPPPPPTE